MANTDPQRRRDYHREYMRRWRKKNPGIGQAYTYRVKVEKLRGMLYAQGFKCAICGTSLKKKTPHVDHHHGTGRVRGLLCSRCNTGLGHVERKGWLPKALKYLRTR